MELEKIILYVLWYLNSEDILFYLSILLDTCIKTYLLGKFGEFYSILFNILHCRKRAHENLACTR